MIDKEAFKKQFKAQFNIPQLTMQQATGIDYLVSKLNKSDFILTQQAYILATIYWEADGTFQPIAERGKGKGYKYGTAVVAPNGLKQTYYGRGYVQLTWLDNYKTMSLALFGDYRLANNPDMVMDKEIAWSICAYGFTKGSFTGKALKHYITKDQTDYVNARRIINGTDKSATIASMAVKMQRCLEASRGVTVPIEKPVENVKEPAKNMAETLASQASIWQKLIELLKRIFGVKAKLKAPF